MPGNEVVVYSVIQSKRSALPQEKYKVFWGFRRESSNLVEENKERLHGGGAETEGIVSGKKQTRIVCCHWSLEERVEQSFDLAINKSLEATVY